VRTASAALRISKRNGPPKRVAAAPCKMTLVSMTFSLFESLGRHQQRRRLFGLRLGWLPQLAAAGAVLANVPASRGAVFLWSLGPLRAEDAGADRALLLRPRLHLCRRGA